MPLALGVKDGSAWARAGYMLDFLAIGVPLALEVEGSSACA